MLYQKLFLNDLFPNCAQIHQQIAAQINVLVNATKHIQGMGIIEFAGLRNPKELIVARTVTPASAISPFQDGHGSNIAIQVWDVTGHAILTDKVLTDCETSGRKISISGLHVSFAQLYGFYEESETLFEYLSFFDNTVIEFKSNPFAFLPNGLSVLGFTDLSIKELSEKYSAAKHAARDIIAAYEN